MIQQRDAAAPACTLQWAGMRPMMILFLLYLPLQGGQHIVFKVLPTHPVHETKQRVQYSLSESYLFDVFMGATKSNVQKY